MFVANLPIIKCVNYLSILFRKKENNMKKIKFTFTFLFLCKLGFGTVLTVNNNGGGQFLDINTAVLAASSANSDTIYI